MWVRNQPVSYTLRCEIIGGVSRRHDASPWTDVSKSLVVEVQGTRREGLIWVLRDPVLRRGHWPQLEPIVD